MGDASSESAVSGLALFGVSVYVSIYLSLAARPLCCAANKKMEQLIDNCPSLQQRFWPPPYCWNPHTQFIPFVIRGMLAKSFPKFKMFREEVVLDDGELLALDWLTDSASDGTDFFSPSNDTTPILMLHHGAFCDSTDMPGQDYITPALQRGWKVCVLNRRGHGFILRKPKWNFFGCVNDVRCATQQIKDRFPNAKLLTIGLSSGTAIIATIFGYDDDINHFHAGVGVCPGYSIETCMARFSSPYMVRRFRKPINVLSSPYFDMYCP